MVVLSFSRDFDDIQGTVGDCSFKVRPSGYLQQTDLSDYWLTGYSQRPPDLRNSITPPDLDDDSLKVSFFSDTTESNDLSVWEQIFTVNKILKLVSWGYYFLSASNAINGAFRACRD